jgi:hypothetical protein
MTCLILALAGSLALAVEPPGPPPHGKTKQQHDWLRDHLAADMEIINTFPEQAYADMRQKVASTSREETNLLADCYQLSRKLAEQEMRLIAAAQIAQAQAAGAQGIQPQVIQPPAAPPEVEADREALRKLYEKLAAARKPARIVSEYIYASLPGWCAQAAQFVPSAYYGEGHYVGPLDSETYAGQYAGPVYIAYFDKTSRFNRHIIHHWWRTYGPAPEAGRNPATLEENDRGRNGRGQGGPSPRPAAPYNGRPVRPLPTTPRYGTYQGNGLQGLGAMQFNRGR